MAARRSFQHSAHARPCMHMQQCSALLLNVCPVGPPYVQAGQWVNGFVSYRVSLPRLHVPWYRAWCTLNFTRWPYCVKHGMGRVLHPTPKCIIGNYADPFVPM